MGVDAAGFRDDVVGQRVEIGGLELGGLAPGEDVGDDRVLAFEGGERLFVGLVLAGLGFLRLVGEAELVEEDFAELLGRGDVERAVGVAVDGFREFVDLDAGVRTPMVPSACGIDGDAFHFHARRAPAAAGLRFRGGCSPVRLRRAAGGVSAASWKVTSASSAAYSASTSSGMAAMSRSLEALVFSAKAKRSSRCGGFGLGGGLGDVGEFDRSVAEQDFREVVHRVPALGGDEGVGEHGVEKRPGDFDAVMEQDGEVEFEVVADFFRGGGEEGFEIWDLRFGIREIPAFVGFPGEGDA